MTSIIPASIYAKRLKAREMLPFSIGKANMTSFLSKAYATASRAALEKMQSEAEDREQN